MKRFILPVVFLVIGAVLIVVAIWRNTSQERRSVDDVSISRVKPTGIIAVKEYDPISSESIHPDVYAKPFVSGVALRVEWKDIEPQEKKFAWNVLDTVFQKAEASGKFVVLILVPGYGTPDWALVGVATEQFARKYGKGVGESSPLPLPWDQAYLLRWFAILGEVSKRYGSRSSLRMIAAAGPTSVSVEMSLPNTEGDIEQWIKLGYRPSLLLGAWQRVFTQYVELFPHQYVSLALYPGLPIGESGQRDLAARADTRAKVVDEGLMYPGQFAIQTSGLHAGINVKKEQKQADRKEARREKRALRRGEEVVQDEKDTTQEDDQQGAGYDIVESLAGKVLTGFQLSTSATRNPTKMGDTKDPVNALRLSLEQGVEAGASYIEVYEPDILNPAMGEVLKEFGDYLTDR